MRHRLGLATRTQVSVCKSPFPSAGTAVSLFCAKTVQQRPLLPREVETWLPDCGVTHWVRIYHLSRPLISQDVHSPMPQLSFGTVCLQKSCCAIRNIVLKDILRHSCLIAVTRPSDRYLTSVSAAFCRHMCHFINLLIIIKRLTLL